MSNEIDDFLDEMEKAVEGVEEEMDELCKKTVEYAAKKTAKEAEKKVAYDFRGGTFDWSVAVDKDDGYIGVAGATLYRLRGTRKYDKIPWKPDAGRPLGMFWEIGFTDPSGQKQPPKPALKPAWYKVRKEFYQKLFTGATTILAAKTSFMVDSSAEWTILGSKKKTK